MKIKKLMASMCLLGTAMTVCADWAMRGVELPISDTASWGENPLTDNTNYRLGSTGGTTGTVSAPDNFTLMSTTSNILLVADIPDSIGVIDMDGGTFNLAGSMRLGNISSGSATLNLSGGNLTIGKDLQVARFQSGVTGIVNMSGGALQVNGAILVGNVANTGETAEFNYTGGTVNMTGEFQLQGNLNFTMGLDPIVADHRVGDQGVISLTFPGGYSHTAGLTQWFIQSETAFQTILLATDSGLVGITPDATGTSVTVNGYDFNLLWTDGAGGGIGVTAVPEPSTYAMLLGLSAFVVCFLRRKTRFR